MGDTPLNQVKLLECYDRIFQAYYPKRDQKLAPTLTQTCRVGALQCNTVLLTKGQCNVDFGSTLS